MCEIGIKDTKTDDLITAMLKSREKFKGNWNQELFSIQKREQSKLAAGAEVIKHVSESSAVVFVKSFKSFENKFNDGERKKGIYDGTHTKNWVLKHEERFCGKMARFGQLLKHSVAADR